MKKKVIEGKINIKYDEIEDIIEILELDPGAQKAINETKDFYKEFINANKNLFILTKDRKNERFDFQRTWKHFLKIHFGKFLQKSVVNHFY